MELKINLILKITFIPKGSNYMRQIFIAAGLSTVAHEDELQICLNATCYWEVPFAHTHPHTICKL